jgi:hypothetical protein
MNKKYISDDVNKRKKEETYKKIENKGPMLCYVRGYVKLK